MAAKPAMKNGMKIGRAVNLFIGVLLGSLTIILPITLGAGMVFASIGLDAGALACFAIGPILLTRGGRLLGQDPILITGQSTSPIIRAVRDTGITLQYGAYTVLEFDLDVSSGTASPYKIACRSTVPRIALSMVGSGKTVAVKIDPHDQHHIAIDCGSAPPRE